MDVLVIAEVRDGKLKKATCECVGVAKKVAEKSGGKVSGLLIGGEDNAKAFAGYGVDIIYHAESESLNAYSTEAYASVSADIINDKKPNVVLAGATNFGKDLMPRVAAKVGAGLATDCIDAGIENGRLVVKRPVYAGKLLIKVGFTTEVMMATLRPNVFPVPEFREVSPTVEKIPVTLTEKELRAKVKETVKNVCEVIDLTEANIIVSGGRGMKSAENFKLLEEMASILSAAVGASRAAVDAGWRPQACQVGQTGKVVTPQLYIACGISGAIQHLAGMGTSKCIVAINKDPNAPIFKVADYGVVCDLFQIVPILTEEFRKLKSTG